MNPDETERYMNIRADSLRHEGKRGSQMSFLYPAMYTVTCRLNIRYFPYDQQVSFTLKGKKYKKEVLLELHFNNFIMD